MSSERWHPYDAIGNHVRKGDLIHLTLPQPSAMFHVVEVEPASSIVGPDSRPIAVQGRIRIACTFDLQYMPGKAMGNVIVVQQPDGEKSPVIVMDEKQDAEARKN